MSIIRKLTRYRWNLLTMAELARSEGCKFVTLMRRLQASDRAVRQSLDYLIESNWVARNTGYGHPLRPEYLLTDEGEAAGTYALRIVEGLGADHVSLGTDRWALPVLSSLETTPLRFGELMDRNSPISPRALAMTLKSLAEAELIGREVGDGFPPSVSYGLTSTGIRLASLLAA